MNRSRGDRQPPAGRSYGHRPWRSMEESSALPQPTGTGNQPPERETRPIDGVRRPKVTSFDSAELYAERRTVGRLSRRPSLEPLDAWRRRTRQYLVTADQLQKSSSSGSYSPPSERPLQATGRAQSGSGWWRQPWEFLQDVGRELTAALQTDAEMDDDSPLSPNRSGYVVDNHLVQSHERMGSIRQAIRQAGALPETIATPSDPSAAIYVTPEGPIPGTLWCKSGLLRFEPDPFAGVDASCRCLVDLRDCLEAGTVCLPVTPASRRYFGISRKAPKSPPSGSNFMSTEDAKAEEDLRSHFYVQLLIPMARSTDPTPAAKRRGKGKGRKLPREQMSVSELAFFDWYPVEDLGYMSDTPATRLPAGSPDKDVSAWDDVRVLRKHSCAEELLLKDPEDKSERPLSAPAEPYDFSTERMRLRQRRRQRTARFLVSHGHRQLPPQAVRLFALITGSAPPPQPPLAADAPHEVASARRMQDFVLFKMANRKAPVVTQLMELVEGFRSEDNAITKQLQASLASPLLPFQTLHTRNSLWDSLEPGGPTRRVPSILSHVPRISSPVLELLTADVSPDSSPDMPAARNTHGGESLFSDVLSALGITRRQRSPTVDSRKTTQDKPKGRQKDSQAGPRDSSAALAAWGGYSNVSFELPEGCSRILDPYICEEISGCLPPTVAVRPWNLVFCVKRDGVSYHTFFRMVENQAPVLLLLRDQRGAIFGSYSPCCIRESFHYYGSGENFVFTFKHAAQDFRTEQDPSRNLCRDGMNGCIKAFQWSSLNAYFMYTDSYRIAFGGGGSYALTIDSEFLRGSSSPCRTYLNPTLSANEDFIVEDFQVWTFR